jgi:lipopolysaccharide exporter
MKSLEHLYIDRMEKTNSLYNILPSFLKDQFVIDTVTLSGGTALAQIVTILASPILTRIYTPEQFGVFSLFATIVSTASVIVCLSYEMAVVLPEKEEDAAKVLLLCILIALLISAAMTLGIIFFGETIIHFLQAQDLLALLWWAPVNLILVGIYQSLNYWYTRISQFKWISVSRFSQSATTAGAQIGVGTLGTGASGLICGLILGQLASSSILAVNAVKRIPQLIKKEWPTPSQFYSLLYRYRKFPLYSSWGTLMNTAAFQVVPPFLSTLFGPAVAGFYFLGFRLASIPISLLGMAIGQVLLNRAAEQLAQGFEIADLVEKIIGKTIMLCVVPFFILLIAAPEIFSIVFGREWETAGLYAQAMIPLYFLQFVTSPVSVVLIALQKQQILALLQAMLLLGAVGSLSLGGRFLNVPIGCLGLYALVQSASYVLYLMIIIRYSSASPLMIFREMVSLKVLRQ